ncbi:hypothetical protein [Erythrobacter sp. MTPC3]|uniref:hypothetical protein n=1 Tax=Erythrobacter sp. MTPC3 TaxID=3056564 RepID=UPI0036F1D428
MIRATSDIADLADRLRAKAERLAVAKASAARSVAHGRHPWRSADALWPTFGQD